LFYQFISHKKASPRVIHTGRLFCPIDTLVNLDLFQ
jgi:hypothetical protein